MNFFGRKIIATHNGSFHADDVFAVAALSLLLKGDIKIIRTRSPEKIATAHYVADVGNVYDFSRNRFDHHQEGGAGDRENGVPYAAFGLVWKHYGETVAGGKEFAEMVDKNLVQFIDSFDNGIGEIKPVTGAVLPFTINNIIENMNPSGDSDFSDFDRAFRRGIDIAVQIIMDAVSIEKEKIVSRAAVESAYRASADRRIIILDEIYSWRDILNKYPEPLFVVEPDYKNTRGEKNWILHSVRDNPNNFTNRRDLPADWAGKRNSALAAVSGVQDAVFCHNKRFLAIAKSKEGALKLANLALNL